MWIRKLAFCAGLVGFAQGLVLAGCGNNNGNSTGYGYGDDGSFGDSGSGDDGASTDDGPNSDATTSNRDSGMGFDAGHDAPPDALDGALLSTGAVFVHASPDLPDLRFCWTVNNGQASGSIPPYPYASSAPASNYPAVPVGGAAPLVDASTMLGGTMQLIGINAALLGTLEQTDSTPWKCFDRLSSGAGGKLPPKDIYRFPDVPAGAIVAGATNVIAVSGCQAGDSSGTVARCGAGWKVGTGNLHVEVLPLHEVSTRSAMTLPVQAAELSAAADLASKGSVTVSFGPQGSTKSVATLRSEGAVAPSAAAMLQVGTLQATSYGTLGFGVDVKGVDGGSGHLWMSLAQSLTLVDPMMDPAAYYGQTTTYVVAVVGDPAAPPAFGGGDASYDGTQLHLLVLPLP